MVVPVRSSHSSTLLSFPQTDIIPMRALDAAKISREDYALLCDCAYEKSDAEYTTSERGILRLLELRHLVYRSEEMQAWRLTDEGRFALEIVKTVASLGLTTGQAKLIPWR